MKSKLDNRKDLLVELVRTNFKLRYNNSFLGFIWVLLKPLMTFMVLYIVFSKFKGGWVENYQMYLLLGIILYTFVNEGIIFGMNGILQIAHIILKVNFPREIALASSLIMAVINLTINLFILALFGLFNPVSPTLVTLGYFILIIGVIFALIYGISFFTSLILVNLRDLQHIAELIMQLLFYATPIFYPIESLPEYIQKIVKLNPLTVLIQAAREALIYGNIKYLNEVGLLLFVSILLFFLGSLYFKNNVKRIAEKF
ncbi:ABC transporter permease [Candidatus Dojkabacteria bacterium]|nr:ABC transporter permease [Candidatus Dojkabacteria bacterium]